MIALPRRGCGKTWLAMPERPAGPQKPLQAPLSTLQVTEREQRILLAAVDLMVSIAEPLGLDIEAHQELMVRLAAPGWTR